MAFISMPVFGFITSLLLPLVITNLSHVFHVVTYAESFRGDSQIHNTCKKTALLLLKLLGFCFTFFDFEV